MENITDFSIFTIEIDYKFILLILYLLSIFFEILFFYILFKTCNQLCKIEILILTFQNIFKILFKLSDLIHWFFFYIFGFLLVPKNECVFIYSLSGLIAFCYFSILFYYSLFHISSFSRRNLFVWVKNIKFFIIFLIFIISISIILNFSIFFTILYDGFYFEQSEWGPRCQVKSEILLSIVYLIANTPNYFSFCFYSFSILKGIRKYSRLKTKSIQEAKRFKKYFKVYLKFFIYSILYILVYIPSFLNIIKSLYYSNLFILFLNIFDFFGIFLIAFSSLFLIFVHKKLKKKFLNQLFKFVK